MRITKLLVILLFSNAAFAAGFEITNLDELTAPLKVSQFKNVKFKRKLKVAIIDNGFAGYESAMGVTLPRDTIAYSGKERFPKDNNVGSSMHGLIMAQLFGEILRKSGAHADYELHLFHSFGWTKFAQAIETIAAGNFDLVLYAQVWEYGGYGDGKGFVNAEVNKVLQSGAVWVNAAGNFARSTRTTKVDGKVEGPDEFVHFSGKNSKGVQLTCTPARGQQQCELRLALAWNDFKEDTLSGTDKDLDLVVYNSSGTPVAASVRKQRLGKGNGGEDLDKFDSAIPRELIEKVMLDKGTYLARVKVISKNFSASQDELRITSSSANAGVITMVDPTKGETILPPADNPAVVVVGASDDPDSSTSEKLSKPDVKVKSTVKLKDGSVIRASSPASAMAAAVIALHLGTMEEKNPDKVLEKLKELKKGVTAAPAARARPKGPAVAAPKITEEESRPRRRLALRSESRRPQDNCLPRTSLKGAHSRAREIIANRGATGVLFRGRTAILVTYDFPKQMGITVPSGYRVYAGPQQLAVIKNTAADPGLEFFEVISTAWGYRVCP